MITYSDELYHHGVKGQRWGVRRYRNEDGTLTQAGKNRELWRQRDGKNDKDFKNDASYNKVYNRVSEDYQNAGNVQSQMSSMAQRGGNIARLVGNKKREKLKSDVDVSSMSDEELRQKINRMSLEKQYRSLSTENVRTGSDRVQDVLSVAGDVMAIGASAAMIAGAIYKIRAGG